MEFTQTRLKDGDRPQRANFDINELRERRLKNQSPDKQVIVDKQIDADENLETNIAAPLIGTLSDEEANQASKPVVLDNNSDAIKARPKREDSDIERVFRRRARVRRVGDIIRAIGTLLSAIIVIYLFWIWIVPIFWG